jgi:hypothetical protein
MADRTGGLDIAAESVEGLALVGCAGYECLCGGGGARGSAGGRALRLRGAHDALFSMKA